MCMLIRASFKYLGKKMHALNTFTLFYCSIEYEFEYAIKTDMILKAFHLGMILVWHIHITWLKLWEANVYIPW